MQTSLKLVNELLDFDNSGIIIVDKDARIINLNLKAKKYLNYKSNITGKLIKNVIPKCCLTTVLATGRTFMGYLNYKGTRIFSIAFPITEMDSIVGAVGVLVNNLESKSNPGETQKTSNLLQYPADKTSNQYQIIYNSTEMQKVVKLSQRIAKVNSTVLLLGETGVGKGALSKMIHGTSNRHNKPFIQVNCCSIPETLFESELFGYEKGSFTGASREGKPGLIEMAQNGTIFLDEIGDLPLSVQSKLLKVIDEMEIMRVGGIKPISLDVRIIAATNKNLKNMVYKNSFRDDLFYRLNVISLKIPPLRKRKKDIIPLAIHFLDKYCRKYNLVRKFSAGAIACLVNYHWPGNIRELQNTIERIVVFSEKEEITEQFLSFLSEDEVLNQTVEVPENGIDSNKSNIIIGNLFEQVEKQLLERALTIGGTSRKAANLLNVNQSTIVRKAKKYGITF